MDSMEHPPPSRLICPSLRAQNSIFNNRNYKTIKGKFFEMIDNSYFSHSVSPHHHHRLDPLYWCNNKESEDEPSWCVVCQCKESSTTYYFCNECNVSYHKECVESPPLIKSPHHPKHHLQLILHIQCFTQVISTHCICNCSYCGSSCRGKLTTLFYYCFICEFSLDPVCAVKPSFLNYQKRHEHTLNYFPRKTDLICDVCGFVDSKSLIYVCLQCDFVVHRNCIYFPFVIKISRHNHRLSFTYSPLKVLLSCGVCRQKIDENYGKYCCTKNCTYVVHSKCAIRKDVWDGIELEEVAEEEEEESENLNSFEVIGDGIIKHFSHSHHMRFEKRTTGLLYDENKRCQACVLPFYGDDVYNCVDSKCDFVLHEACANLPRRKNHVAHLYPFILQVSDNKNFYCGCCSRFSNGFRYVCSKGDETISLDVRCAAISEPFDHQSHPHPLFLSNELGKYRSCSMCGKKSIRTLNCIEYCDFSLCFYCATLPYIVRSEHDEHFLTLSYEENASLKWCEVCEETLDSHKWLYTCNECAVAFHIACLLGKCAFYVKPAQNLLYNGETKINITLSNGLTRPICTQCQKRCQDKLVVQFLDDYDGEVISCYRHWEVNRTKSQEFERWWRKK
ncbi:PREDICTED: uncharacterized protein LOC106325218 [Brassica oleracea var. oleracea]|uniref:uncharacterized protein LOC106325218 n=1 Tax=Brassica oleracea var. oleracea TaxID=109376 RepID=UPI0006A6FCA2|nr:PREDICTED: uncharacterized protein LOC106325218 [Brassica oleracea var. oleracea]